MERKIFAEQFSQRLVHKMQENGYSSERSSPFVQVNKLAKIAECSYQMARKYVLGLALPDPITVIKIADWLKVPPGWLFFDGVQAAVKNTHVNTDEVRIEITPHLLKYILIQSLPLLQVAHNVESVIDFIVNSIYDASHLSTDIKTIHKVVDMMVASAKLFNAKPIEKDLQHAA